MTTLEKLVSEQESAPTWKLAARASREWKLVFLAGSQQISTCKHVVSPLRCFDLAAAEWENAQPQGCTRLEVYLNDELVHVFEEV